MLGMMLRAVEDQSKPGSFSSRPLDKYFSIKASQFRNTSSLQHIGG